MILLIVLLAVGWVLLSVYGMFEDSERSALYITLLTAGTVSWTLVLVGTVIYLALSVKAINLNRRQSNFIDSVTHELKSPIASLKLYLQTLDRHPRVGQRARWLLPLHARGCRTIRRVDQSFA